MKRKQGVLLRKGGEKKTYVKIDEVFPKGKLNKKKRGGHPRVSKRKKGMHHLSKMLKSIRKRKEQGEGNKDLQIST